MTSSPLAVPSALLCVYGKNTSALVAAIDHCQQLFLQRSQQAPAEIIDHWHQINVAPTDTLTVSIVGSETTEFIALLDQARESVEAGSQTQGTGVFYEPHHLTDHHGSLAFVFPGSGNHYSGMSRQLSLPACKILDENDSRHHYLLEQFANGQ